MHVSRKGREKTLLAGLGLITAVLLAGCATSTATVDGDRTPDSGDATAALTAAVAAANTDDPNAADFVGAKSGSGTGLVVGYISAGEASPFVHALTVGVQEQAEKAGVDLRICDAQFDAAKALQCANDLSTQGITGLFNMQVDAASAPAICAVNDVPTIALAIHQKPCELSFVGAEDERAGYLAGVAMGAYVDSRFGCDVDKIFSLEDVNSGETNTKRVKGWTEGFQSICGDSLEFVHIDTAGLIDESQKAMTDALTTAPDSHRVVVFTIDDNAALGALAAASSLGRKGDLFVASQGGDASGHCEIRSNPQWVADVGYFPERYGEIAIPAMIALLGGDDINPDLHVQHSVFNSTNIDQFYPDDNC
ncbi:MAG: substrate-binding domain-containing protein [Salinibacterium sp.]|nr:substrate-binding domain-containing protein [Salinibacterium sp.]